MIFRCMWGCKTFNSSHFSVHIWTRKVGRGNAVGIETHYGLDGQGIESRWEVTFSEPVQTGPGAQPASYTRGNWSFPRVKRLGCGVDHPPPSNAEVKESVELYLYSPSGPSWTLPKTAKPCRNVRGTWRRFVIGAVLCSCLVPRFEVSRELVLWIVFFWNNALCGG